MSIEDFKRTAELRLRSEQLAAELQKKSAARRQAVLDDFREKAMSFLRANDFEVEYARNKLRATYSGSTLEMDLPEVGKPLIGALAIIDLTLNRQSRGRLALLPSEASARTDTVFVKQPSQAERLERDIAGLEAAIAKYDSAPVYKVQYFVNKPQPSPQEARGVVFDTAEEAVAAVLHNGG